MVKTMSELLGDRAEIYAALEIWNGKLSENTEAIKALHAGSAENDLENETGIVELGSAPTIIKVKPAAQAAAKATLLASLQS